MVAFSLPASRSYDDPHSIAVLTLFLLAAFVTIRPIIIPIPLPSFVFGVLYHLRLRDDQLPIPKGLYRLHIDLNIGPIAAVLILLASKSIGIVEFRAGIQGLGGVHPYDILLLFLSLAYIAISLDATGALRYLAFSVAKKGGTSGWKLHFYLYLFFIVLSAVVGNDPVILSGTAFLSYFTEACGIKPPTAWIFSQFMAANLTSMVFVSSNPTNLVISAASGINFIFFSGWTIIPALFSSAVLYPILMLQFFGAKNPDLVPRLLKTPEVNPRGELKDVFGAIFKAALLAATLVTLIVSSVFVKGLFVWWVTLPAALIVVFKDVTYDLKHASKARKDQRESEKDRPPPILSHRQSHDLGDSPILGDINSSTVNINENNGVSDRPGESDTTRWTLSKLIARFEHRFPTFYVVISRMPWPLLPFAFSFFILVDSLSSSGWITVWAGWLSTVVRNNDVIAVFFVGFICILLCNISTNIGATLILVNIIYDAEFANANPSKRVQYGALMATAVCSNIGAYSFVFPASLAGLLWRGILKQKGVEVHSLDFIKHNVLPLVVTATVALAVVVAEVRVIFPEDAV